MKNAESPSAEILSQIFPFSFSKAQLKQIDIIEGAIKCYATLGEEGATYEKIAKYSKITRPLILHYFKDKTELFYFTARYIRAKLQEIAVEAVSQETTEPKQLKAYIESCFYWLRKYPHHSKVWVLFYHKCTLDNDLRQLNNELVNMGFTRIQGLIKSGIKNKKFRKVKVPQTAKSIQLILTASLLECITQGIDTDKASDATVKACMELVQL